jgi:hypothetical protein
MSHKSTRLRGVFILGIVVVVFASVQAVFFLRVPSSSLKKVSSSTIPKNSENDRTLLESMNLDDVAPHGSDVKTEPTISHHSVLGTWKQEPREGQVGQRHLKIEEGGKGVLTIEIEGWQSFIVGAKIVVEVTWTLVEQRVKLKLEQGDPKFGFEQVVREIGNAPEYEVEFLSEDTVVFTEVASSEKFGWMRVNRQ